jgi:hypothetical protein
MKNIVVPVISMDTIISVILVAVGDINSCHLLINSSHELSRVHWQFKLDLIAFESSQGVMEPLHFERQSW